MTVSHETFISSNQEAETWPYRYSVRAVITYRSRRGKSGTLQVITYQPDMPDHEIQSILESAGYTPAEKNWLNLVSQAKDTFSLPQAESLVAYLNARSGTTAIMKPAVKPQPLISGASMIPLLPSFRDGIVYRYYTERGYPLPFKVEAINMKTYLYMSRLFREIKGL